MSEPEVKVNESPAAAPPANAIPPGNDVLLAFSGPGFICNRMHFVSFPGHVRMVFGEEVAPGNVSPRAAVAVSIADFMRYAKSVAEIADMYQKQQSRVVVAGARDGK